MWHLLPTHCVVSNLPENVKPPRFISGRLPPMEYASEDDDKPSVYDLNLALVRHRAESGSYLHLIKLGVASQRTWVLF